MRVCNFIFDCVYLLYYKCHKINPNRGGLYIDPPDWIKNKKVAINLINKKDNKYFQHAVTVTLNHKNIVGHYERITKIKLFVNKYNWERISYLSEKDNWKKIEKNNLTIALDVLYAKNEKVYPAYISKHNSSREKQVIYFNDSKWRMFLSCSKKSIINRNNFNA